MATRDSLIQVTDLKKYYNMGAIKALDGITVDIHEGDVMAVIGPSGSGKSTLMNILGCLDRPTSGHYYIAGEDVAKFNAAERATLRNKRIGFVFQNFNLLSRTTALENVMMPAVYAHPTLSMKAMRERSVELLNLVGLSDRMDHTPAQLSGGQQQRVAIARALVSKPAIVLADEPTGNLDEDTAQDITDILKESAHRMGKCVVVVTHSNELAKQADVVFRLRKGELQVLERVQDGAAQSQSRRNNAPRSERRAH